MFFAVLTFGELYILPVGLGMFAQLALPGLGATTIAAWFLASSYAAALLTLLVPLVWVRHHENIARLLKGSEPKIGQRGKPQDATPPL